MTSWTAAVLAEELDEIVRLYEMDVRLRIEVLREAPRPVVHDHVVDVLRALVFAIDRSEAMPALEALGRSHGVQRASHGVALVDLVHEHRLLRERIASVVAGRAPAGDEPGSPDPARAREMVRLHEALDVVVAGAVDSHSAVRAGAPSTVHDRLRLALVASGIGAWDYDPTLGSFEVDERARELFALEDVERPFGRDEVVGKVDPTCREALERALAGGLERGEALHLELLVRGSTAGALERWVKIDGRPLRDDRGASVRLFGTVLDVTEHRHLERTRDRFLAVLGHDLRSPLNAIAMAAHLLSTSRDPQQVAIVARVSNSVRRMEALIRDLLDFTRAAVGTPLPVSPRPTDIDVLCRKVLEEVRGGHPGVSLTYVPGERPDGVWDPARLEQVLANLLTNAVKYGDLEAPITLRWSREEEGGLRVEVHNEGEPIPRDLQPHVFDAFRMGSNARGAAQTSAGVGLYVVAQIVRAHGGEVELASSTEAGTTFRVRLPARAPGGPVPA